MTTLLFSNNATSTLAAPVSAGATTITLASGTGALFPAPVSGQAFMLTLTDAATGLLTEIVQVTGRTSDILTVVRAQEGTTALTWSAGDIAANLLTAGTTSTFLQAGDTGGVYPIASNITVTSGGVTLASFTVPATGVIAVSLNVTAQPATVLSANTYGVLSANILQNSTIVSAASAPFYVPSGGGVAAGSSTSIAYLSVSAGQTISAVGYLIPNGDGATAWKTVMPSGSTISNALSYHYVR